MIYKILEKFLRNQEIWNEIICDRRFPDLLEKNLESLIIWGSRSSYVLQSLILKKQGHEMKFKYFDKKG